MSKSEDYLDQLLKGINEPEEAETGLEDDVFGEDLLDEDLLDESFMDGDLSDDFLKEFEMELEGLEGENLFEDVPGEFMAEESVTEEDAAEDAVIDEQESVEDLFDNLDSIISGTLDSAESSEADFNVEAFSYDDVGTDPLSSDVGISEPEAAMMPEAEAQLPDGEADVLKILEGLGDIDLELDTGVTREQTEESKANDDALLNFLAGDAMTETEVSDFDVLSEDSTTEAEQAPAADDKKKKKDKKKSAKKGEQKSFMSKLGTLLFGEDEDEEVQAPVAEKSSEEAAPVNSDVQIQELTDDTLDLFKDFAPEPKAPVKEEAQEPEEKEKKKKKKEKKEKVKKEKKPKPKKEKKPKKPKEPDNSPPLPKKPVLLIIIMVASLVALIIVGTDLLGYNNSMTNAKNAFVKKNYTEAYSYVSGIEIKEKDMPLYEKYQTMALISSEYDAYKNLMAGEFYDMALDSLVRMVGRCDKFREDAKTYECIKELKALESEAESILNETFKMTKEEAIELYQCRDRRDYSKTINAILKELGMEKVIEE